ncbi:MAG: RNA polymerase sigma-70 factor (ECF subfamily) [Oceanicoccus sp.]
MHPTTPFMPLTDPEIDGFVTSSKEGDKDAFGQLYDHFFDKIYRYVFFRVPAHDVEDIVETIFIKSWTKMDSYEKRDVKFSSWLFRIAHNAVIDYRRAHKKVLPMDPRIKDESIHSAPKKMAEQNLRARQVREAVNQLKEPYRQLVTLKFLIGLSNSEIAEIMRQREGNVRVMQFRALKQLKNHLSEKDLTFEF